MIVEGEAHIPEPGGGTITSATLKWRGVPGGRHRLTWSSPDDDTLGGEVVVSGDSEGNYAAPLDAVPARVTILWRVQMLTTASPG